MKNLDCRDDRLNGWLSMLLKPVYLTPEACAPQERRSTGSSLS
ncbi:hypothetical protein [Chamaesiphon minutus]|nr:hypothetical protein [Chamaesiphon minutus]